MPGIDIALEHIPGGIRLHRDACIFDESFRPDFWRSFFDNAKGQHAPLTPAQLGDCAWMAADNLTRLTALNAGESMDIRMEDVEKALGL